MPEVYLYGLFVNQGDDASRHVIFAPFDSMEEAERFGEILKKEYERHGLYNHRQFIAAPIQPSPQCEQ